MMSAMLAGLRVADLSIVTAGAGATQALADFGADVVKVEGNQHPDLFRGWNSDSPLDTDDLSSPPFRTVNRNKRAIAVDLKTPMGREVTYRLVAASDVVVENFRRGAVERLGLGFEDLVSVRPDIVLVSLSSQGATGPNSSYSSFGSTLDALGGIMSITGYDAQTPQWSSNKVNFPDQIVSMLAPALVLAGVMAARRDGQARWIDLSQREVVTSLLGEWILTRSVSDLDPVPTGNNGAGSHAWCTPCAGDDEWVAVSLSNNRHWENIAAVVGHREPLSGTGASISLRRSTARWSRRLGRDVVSTALQNAGVPAAPVKRGHELLSDPYFTELDWFRPAPLPSGGSEQQRGWLVRFDEGGPRAIQRPAPHIGEHTKDILAELGYDDREIGRLLSKGVVSVPPSTQTRLCDSEGV